MTSVNATTLWDIWHGAWAPESKAPQEPTAESECHGKSTALQKPVPDDPVVTKISTAADL